MVDSQGRKWEVMERVDGSVVCFYTRPDLPGHYVVWDSLDAAQHSVQRIGSCAICGSPVVRGKCTLIQCASHANR